MHLNRVLLNSGYPPGLKLPYDFQQDFSYRQNSCSCISCMYNRSIDYTASHRHSRQFQIVDSAASCESSCRRFIVAWKTPANSNIQISLPVSRVNPRPRKLCPNLVRGAVLPTGQTEGVMLCHQVLWNGGLGLRSRLVVREKGICVAIEHSEFDHTCTKLAR